MANWICDHFNEIVYVSLVCFRSIKAVLTIINHALLFAFSNNIQAALPTARSIGRLWNQQINVDYFFYSVTFLVECSNVLTNKPAHVCVRNTHIHTQNSTITRIYLRPTIWFGLKYFIKIEYKKHNIKQQISILCGHKTLTRHRL